MADEPFEVELEILPAPGGADAVDPAAPRRMRRVPRRGLAVLGVLAVAVGAFGFVVLRDDTPDPDTALRDAQRALDDVDGFRFELSAEETTSTGDEVVGTAETERYTAVGDWSRDAWRVETRTPDGLREALVDGNDIYTREGGPLSRTLERLRWIRADDDRPFSGGGGESSSVEVLGGDADGDVVRVDANDILGEQPDSVEELDLSPEEQANLLVTAATNHYLGNPAGVVFLADGFNHEPDGFLRLIEWMTATQVTEEADGGRRIDGRVRPRAPREGVPAATVSLYLAADDEPERLRFAVRQGGASTTFDVRFGDWDEPVHVQVPTAEEIDTTPDIDEAALQARGSYMDAVWPTAVPTGWELTSLTAGNASGVFPDEPWADCQTIELEWTDPTPDPGDDDFAFGYLRIANATTDCMIAADPTPFTPDGPGGRPTRWRADTLEARVGEAVVLVDTTLSDEQLVPVLASLAPVDIDTLIAAAAEADV